LRKAISTALQRRPGQAVEYSDIGFIVLWAAAEAAHGAPLQELLQQRVFEPLGMYATSFRPGESCLRCAPTSEKPGYRGIVHDPIARRLGGIAGHAGLFSTAHDLSIFAAMLVNRGAVGEVRVLRSETIDLFTQRQPGAGTRALGWDTPAPDGAGAGGLQISRAAFGHTGFTGTSLWVDPARGTWAILLSNRTYDERGPNRMQAIRRELNDRIASSIDLGSD
jgi:CubicO group peptidase (beta-lactamase class C family)